MLEFEVIGGGPTIELSAFRAVVAGYTGRDAAAVQHHIDELAAIGVAPPPRVPMFYEVDPRTVDTSDAHVRRSGALTSGEVEPVYVRAGGRYYLGVGSDHTDRDLETVDIGDSKRACPKPVSRRLLPVDDFERLDLDDVVAESHVDGRLYQYGSLVTIRRPAEIVALLDAQLGFGDADLVCFGGTIPLLSGEFIDGTDWRVALRFPDGTTLDHHYTMKGTNES